MRWLATAFRTKSGGKPPHSKAYAFLRWSSTPQPSTRFDATDMSSSAVWRLATRSTSPAGHRKCRAGDVAKPGPPGPDRRLLEALHAGHECLACERGGAPHRLHATLRRGCSAPSRHALGSSVSRPGAVQTAGRGPDAVAPGSLLLAARDGSHRHDVAAARRCRGRWGR